MIPTNNNNISPCDPISSNCVIWQGPDIPCINLCKGDNISIVIHKLATELCDVIAATCDCNPDLTGLDLSCIPPPAQVEPNLTQYLQSIIDYVCTLPTQSAAEVVVELPDCLHYRNSQGNPVTSLPIDEYALYLANKICDIISAITLINNQITNILNRLSILEGCVLPCDPDAGNEVIVFSSCLLPGQLIPVSTLLLKLETEFCDLETAVGDPSAIFNAINATCLFGSSAMLSQNATYSSQSNWIQNPSTLAGINQNQWIAICDIRQAVLDIQENCCSSDCSSIIYGVTYSMTEAPGTGLPQLINFNFTSSDIPASYTDCGTSKITLIDASGNSIQQPIDVVNLSNFPGGVTIDLSSSGLILTQPIAAQITFCSTDGLNTCSEIQNISIPLTIPCPPSVSITPSIDTVLVSFLNYLGAGYNYTITVTDNLTGLVVSSVTFASPGSSISHTFTGLASNTAYTLNATITNTTTSQSVLCPLGGTITLGVTCANTDTTVFVTDTPDTADLYLGAFKSGILTEEFYFDATGNRVVRTGAFIQSCNNPSVTILSVVGGTVTANIGFNNFPTGSVTYEYSNDMLNWTGGTTIAAAATVSMVTGYGSGSIYIRAFEDCGSGNTSPYTIVRYDFNTTQVTVIQDQYNCVPDFLDACPAGVWVTDGTLTCGVSYTVSGGSLVDSRWYYVGKINTAGTIKYVYAGWKEDGSLARVVACCECPAFILTQSLDTIVVSQGQETEFVIPYLLGDGTATITIISNPVFGSLVQTGSGNVFTYTHNGAASFGDTFTIQLTSFVAGECSVTTAVIPIQILSANIRGVQNNDIDVFAFINTNGFNPATDPAKLVTLTTNLNAAFQAVCPAWTGTLYTIPTTSNRWLSYAKAIVDDGVSASLNGDPAWSGLTSLPTSWTGGAAVVNTRAYIIALSNSSATDYHAVNLTTGWGAQPTASYLGDYEEYIDILLGTEVSAWAQAQGFGGTPPFADGVQLNYYPITSDTTGVTAASILQGLGSYVAKMINPSEYGVKTAVDVSGYLMSGAIPSATNPYEGTFTTGGVAVQGLYTKSVMMWLDQQTQPLTLTEYLDEIIAETDAGDFKNKMITLFLGDGSCPGPVAPEEFEWKYCDAGSTYNLALPVTDFPAGTVDGGVYQTSEGRCIEVRTSLGTATGTEILPGSESYPWTSKTDCACCLATPVYRGLEACVDPGVTDVVYDECNVLTAGDVIKMNGTCWTVTSDILTSGTAYSFTTFVDCPTCLAS